MAPVKRLYLNNPYLTTLDTVIKAISHEPYYSVKLEATIFHPQCSGQPSDHGTINNLAVNQLKYAKDHEIEHIFLKPQNFILGQMVHLRLDEDRRFLLSRYHTAGHLITGVMRHMFPNLTQVSTDHSPTHSCLQFKASSILEHELIHKNLTRVLDETIAKRLPIIQIEKSDKPSSIAIKGFEPIRCGGTHVRNIREIGNINIRQLRTDDNILTIRYRLDP